LRNAKFVNTTTTQKLQSQASVAAAVAASAAANMQFQENGDVRASLFTNSMHTRVASLEGRCTGFCEQFDSVTIVQTGNHTYMRTKKQ
jgi:hypothetical protein